MEDLIHSFLVERNWVQGAPKISFLAAGEYNQNFLVQSGDTRLVFRINHGSQLGLADQIGYEFKVLQCVEPSKVTPRPLRVHTDPRPFGGGVMLMQHLPGEALVYERDLARAADIFARIHALPPCPELLVQKDPIAAIASESLTLINRYPDHALTRQRGRLLDYHQHIVRLGQDNRALFAADRLCVVNTEVNSGNFLITPGSAYLVDWEKAVVSSRHQDLGHFLSPTTTLWRTETILAQEQKDEFLKAYHRRLPDPPALKELMRLSRIMEQVIILRGLSWCFMAHHEYTHAAKPLTDPLTRKKIELYMRDLDRIIASAP
ncbi:Phosphotransferase enzyme family protein [Desulfomicrobium norvegicum]|uniref:Phosphotransferase enzyme family protein n=1 Tax=Desulfomicrobium norvegicum (strain DSM 1741 / NCIMB 8310) TaxID=52561 RepID=A0A8G2F488_DESNO|nr:phosphotransferase [Desulfomicrobium norvegicum]SFL64732.1 Phosphotransferase enzyme family protein [Desulfomicrobium norvegicum]